MNQSDAQDIKTGSSGFAEVESFTYGDTGPPSFQTISLPEGANSNARTRFVIAIPAEHI